MTRGGKRNGAGRPSKMGVPTIPCRVPAELAPKLKGLTKLTTENIEYMSRLLDIVTAKQQIDSKSSVMDRINNFWQLLFGNSSPKTQHDLEYLVASYPYHEILNWISIVYVNGGYRGSAEAINRVSSGIELSAKYCTVIDQFNPEHILNDEMVN